MYLPGMAAQLLFASAAGDRLHLRPLKLFLSVWNEEPAVPIAVVCPQCGKQMQVNAELAGRKGKCPQCQAVFVVAAPKGPVPLTPASSGAPLKVDQARQQIERALAGTVAPLGVGIFRRLAIVIVLAVLLLMPVFYCAAIGAVVAGMYWARASGRLSAISPALFWAAEAIGGVLLVGLLKPLLEPRRRVSPAAKEPLDGQPALRDFLRQLCQQLDAPLPAHWRLECSTELSVSADRGRFGLSQGGLVLTLGLPAMACLSAEQLAGVLADQLSFYRRGAASSTTELVRTINGWLWQSVYGQGRLDQWLALVAQRPHFHAAKLLLPLRGLKWAAQAVLFVPMFVANTIASTILRRAEYDADRLTVRLVGRRTFANLLAQRELIDFAWQGVLAELDYLLGEQQLPDSLPQQLAVRMLDTTPELYAALRDTISDRGNQTFDSRATNEERLAAIESEPPEGLFHCKLPATVLFEDFPAVAKQMTWDYYVSRFGPQRLKTALTPVAIPPAATA